MPRPRDISRTDSTGRAHAGSQRQIQTYVNERTNALNSAIAASLSLYALDTKDIRWVSPLTKDMYAEYQDTEFLERVGLGRLARQLSEFWPRGGPCWDALATTKEGCILVEAKSHVLEVYGKGCGASPRSLTKIQAALNATKAWLGVSREVDWTGRLYQSANRFASLHFLREIASVPAFLVNIYFLDDPHSPTTRKDWEAAIEDVHHELGLVRDVPFSASVFLTAT